MGYPACHRSGYNKAPHRPHFTRRSLPVDLKGKCEYTVEKQDETPNGAPVQIRAVAIQSHVMDPRALGVECEQPVKLDQLPMIVFDVGEFKTI
jgi:hypothetical protein